MKPTTQAKFVSTINGKIADNLTRKKKHTRYAAGLAAALELFQLLAREDRDQGSLDLAELRAVARDVWIEAGGCVTCHGVGRVVRVDEDKNARWGRVVHSFRVKSCPHAGIAR